MFLLRFVTAASVVAAIAGCAPPPGYGGGYATGPVAQGYGPVYGPGAPVYRQSPGYRQGPVYRQAPVYGPAPAGYGANRVGGIPPQGTQALIGAGVGALIADAADENVVAGAALGALAGTYCGDLGLPGCTPHY